MRLKEIFEYHLKRWEEKTIFMSSCHTIIADEDFQEIVKMKRLAIPYILKEIEERPSTLVWALNIITGETKGKERDTITDACKRWVKWGYMMGHIGKRDRSVMKLT